MSFYSELQSLPIRELSDLSQRADSVAVERALSQPHLSLADFAALISPAAFESHLLKRIAQRAHLLTIQRFGKAIRLFAPLYLSNECVNACKYCGFNRHNNIQRKSLNLKEVDREMEFLYEHGFRSLLLVASENPLKVSNSYLCQCAELAAERFSEVCFEVAPTSVQDYRNLVEAGTAGITVFQETYIETTYGEFHPSGPKRNFQWRLETPERAYEGGMKKLGLGVLLGLSSWQKDVISLAAHVQYLLKHCWKAQIGISFPRLRPHAGRFMPEHLLSDRQFVGLVCALRILFPDVAMTLSTRESPEMRNRLFPLGFTSVSAGSHTEPGGYTYGSCTSEKTSETPATTQFEIADSRTPEEVSAFLKDLGYEPVWKDWERSLSFTEKVSL